MKIKLKNSGKSSTVGPLALGVTGMAAGGWIAGTMLLGASGTAMATSIGFMAGSILGSILFPMDDDTEMPEVGDYPIQKSNVGVPIPVVYGTVKMAGNVIWMGELQSQTIKHSSGGKGGGGGGTTSTEIRYKRSFLIALCEGPASIKRIWAGKNEIDLTSATVYYGDGNSGIGTLIDEDFSEYKNICCAYFEDYELGNSQGLPNFNFEVSSQFYGLKSYCISGQDLYVMHGMGPTLDAGPAVDTGESGQRVALPCSFHPFKVGDKIVIGGTTNYDYGNGYEIMAISETHITIDDGTFSSETFQGNEMIVQYHQDLLEDFGYGHGCVVGDYYYVPIQYAGDYETCIIRIKLSTLEIESDWAEQPTEYPFDGDGGSVGMNAQPTSDGLYIILQTLDWECLYKFRISDGACVWEHHYHNGQNNNYGLAVKSNGDCFIAGVKDEYEYGRGKPVRVSADGDDTRDDVAFLDPPGDSGGSGTGHYCVALNEENSLVAFGGPQYNSGSNYSNYPLVIFDSEDEGGGGTPPDSNTDSRELLKWDFGESNNGTGIYQLLWYNGFLYAYTSTVTHGGVDTNFFKFRITITEGLLGIEYDIDVDAYGYVNKATGMFIGADGHIWVPINSYLPPSDTSLNILDKDDLSVRRTLNTPAMNYAPNPIITSAEYALNTNIDEDVHDENPANIIYDILTNGRYGAGISALLVNSSSFQTVREYCENEEIFLSLVVTQFQPVLDWVAYVLSHFGGYRYWVGGQLHIGVFQSESSVASLTADNLVSETGEPPVIIKKREYTDTHNKLIIRWTDRENDYNSGTAVANDEVDQRISGQVREKVIDLKGITDADLALKIAYRMLVDALHRFSSYSFMVGFKDMLLEVGDVIDLTDGYQLTSAKMRITGINEDVNGKGLSIDAVEDISSNYPSVATGAIQTTTYEGPTAISLVSSKITFREHLNEKALILSCIPGSNQCDGWDIYRSYDGVSYDLIGRALRGDEDSGEVNHYGLLTSNLATAKTIAHRSAQSFEVNVGTSFNMDTGVSDTQFFGNMRLAKIGDEIIAYKSCVETGIEGVWTISNLIRGLMGTTPSAHSIGDPFYTLNSDFLFLFQEEDVGRTVYFKAATFYRSQIQSVAEAVAYAYVIKGNYSKPAAASLVRLNSDENDDGDYTYPSSPFSLYWNLGSKISGFNIGGYDVNSVTPSWKYGDSEALLIAGNGVPYGSFVDDEELQEVELTFEETDGTLIGSRSVGVVETASIDDTTDLDSNDPAVIKVTPRRVLGAIKDSQITVENG